MADEVALPGAVGEAEPSRHAWVLAALIVACTAPLVAAAVGMAQKGWIPAGEFAQAELRVRDFWAHPPSLGAVGRLRTSTDVSSHPGPAAWWSMYPVYAVFGRSAVALSASVAATAGAWAAAAIALAWRRGGDALAVVLGLGLLGVMAALGPLTFIEPWNPWFAVMPFLCLVIAVWTVCEDHPWGLGVVVAAGTYCVQAHLGYAPLVAVLGATAVFGMWWSGPRRGGPDAAGRWRRLAGPVAAAVGIGAVMWLPPVLQQLTGDPGNVSVMVQAYREEAGREPALGLGGALELVGAYLNVRGPSFVVDDLRPTERSPDLGTLVVLVAWGLAAIAAWRRRSEPRLRSALVLMAVVGVGMVASVGAASRIPGDVFGYLILWLGVLVALAVVAICWTGWLLLDRPAGAEEQGLALRRILAGSSAALVAVGAVSLVVDFADPPVPAGQLSDAAEELVDPVAEALPGDGPYLVRWDDPIAFGGIGTAVLSELERRGVAVGVDDRLRVEMRPQRVLADSESEGAIWVVSGVAIEEWRQLPGVVELAHVDPRSAGEIVEFERLRAQVLRELEVAGGDELAAELDRNYWAVRTDPRVDRELADRVDALAALGLPTAVFLAPTGVRQPSPQYSAAVAENQGE